MKNLKSKIKNLKLQFKIQNFIFYIISILIFSFLLLHSNCFAADQLTITTYYPSPYGSYQELRSQRIAVGNTYINNSVVCWGGAGAGCPGGSVDPGAATSVVVEGNFGIGTIAPAEKLEVSGNIKLSGATRKITNVAEPTDDSDVATKAYVDGLAGGVQWEGYTTSTYNGSMGSIKGMNDKCNADYSGSHACTYEEILRLGTTYPWSSLAWAVDGSYYTEIVANVFGQVTRDGTNFASSAGMLPMCGGWSSGTATYYGPYYAAASQQLTLCTSALRIPCCK